METKTQEIKLWQCPKCGRRFERQNQSHSCKSYKLEQHFINKDESKQLYKKLCSEIKHKIGAFKIESLECCIHFVSIFTFAAVKILKDKILVDFSLSRQIKSKRIKQPVRISVNRVLYVIPVFKEEDIDTELINWIKEAYDKK